MTVVAQLDPNRETPVTRAAQWLADQPRNPSPLIPDLQARFDLTYDEALEAIVMAGRMQVLRRAFG